MGPEVCCFFTKKQPKTFEWGVKGGIGGLTHIIGQMPLACRLTIGGDGNRLAGDWTDDMREGGVAL